MLTVQVHARELVLSIEVVDLATVQVSIGHLPQIVDRSASG